MADTTTPNYGFCQPEIGASRDTWGAKWNVNLGQIDTILGAAMPIGALIDFAGAFAPAGWLLADGTLYTVALYPRLFAAIGNRYGGDGVTNFAVPDSRARVLAGVGNTTDDQGVYGGFTIGEVTGRFGFVIGQANLPNYLLPANDSLSAHTHTGYTDAPGDHQHGGGTDAQGAHAHNVNAFGAVGGPNMIAPGPIATGTPIGTDVQGAHVHNIATTWNGNHTHQVQTYGGQGVHSHQTYLGGSGVALPTYQPTLAVTKIIYCGPPGFAGTSSLPLMTARGFIAAPMRGVH